MITVQIKQINATDCVYRGVVTKVKKLFDMELYMIINIIGLIIDLCGFIGIYLTKLDNVSKLDNRLYEVSRYTNRSQDLPTITREIIDSVNRKLESINKSHQDQDRKTLKYFKIVIVGVSLQIISIIVYYCHH